MATTLDPRGKAKLQATQSTMASPASRQRLPSGRGRRALRGPLYGKAECLRSKYSGGELDFDVACDDQARPRNPLLTAPSAAGRHSKIRLGESLTRPNCSSSREVFPRPVVASPRTFGDPPFSKHWALSRRCLNQPDIIQSAIGTPTGGDAASRKWQKSAT